MKCLILGGRGFLGSHLCEALVHAGHAVRAFDRPRVPAPGGDAAFAAVEMIDGDFINRDDVAAALAGCEVVFHLVSTTLPKSSNDNPVYDIETNVAASVNMLECARNKGVRKIVFVSSGGTVYGLPQRLPVRESDPTDPVCSYGIGKLAIEKYLRLYRHLHGLDYCVLRLANPYGERQQAGGAQGAATVFLYKALRGESIEIWGDGSVVRDYLYVRDAMSAFLRAMEHTGEQRVFNIGSGRGHSLNELIAAIEQVSGHPVPRRYLPARSFDAPVNVLDIGLAAQDLGWRPATSLLEGLARTRDWMRNDIAQQAAAGTRTGSTGA